MADFDTLWRRFPRDSGLTKTCVLKHGKPFDDYCAVKLSECLMRSNVPLAGFRGKKCWSHSGAKHALLAEDLARYFKLHPPSGFGTLEEIPPRAFQSILADRNGVIFFKDFWRRTTGAHKQTMENRSGDHIDLWKEDQITSSGMFWRGIAEFFGLVSDLNQSRQIWFWEVK